MAQQPDDSTNMMPDKNFVEQKEQPNIADQITEGFGLPKQSEDVPMPSTKEAQEGTERSKEFKDRIRKKQSQIKRNFGKEPSFSEAQHMVIEDIKTDEEKRKTKEAQQIALDKQKFDKEKAQKEQRLQKYIEGKEFAEQNPDLVPNFEVDKEMEEMLAQREVEANQAEQQASERLQEELQKKQQMEALAEQQEVEKEKEVIQKQERVVKAQEQRALEKAVETQQDEQKIEEKFAEEDSRVDFTNFDEYWESRSTGQKILTGIGMFLGVFGGAKNGAVEVINKAIEDNIAAKKVAKEEYWREKEHNLKVIDSKLKQERNKIQNEKTKTEIEKLRLELDNIRQNARNQRKLQESLKSGRKINLFDLPKEQREEASRLRKEYNQQMDKLKTKELVARYQTIVEAAKAPEAEKAAADLSLIFSYMKILDPMSVVREGEFATASSAGSVPQRLVAQYNRVLNGGRLSDAQRQAFVNQSTTTMKSKMKLQDNLDKRYSNLARSSGVPAYAVVEEFSNVFSKREQLIQKQLQSNKKLTRKQVESSIDNLIKKGELSERDFGR